MTNNKGGETASLPSLVWMTTSTSKCKYGHASLSPQTGTTQMKWSQLLN